MYPDSQHVVLWRDHAAVRLSGDEVLDLDPALPGFRRPIRDLFPPPLEELIEPVEDEGGTNQ
jgi:hypothetical protein